MKRLSIIIPMYNVAHYVERCVRSLEDQDIPRDDYEIICINDGSPDNSGEIVKKLQKEFHNLVLIDQQNQGVSRARNNGIDKASGEYLLFIDPDDFVEINSFARILETADEFQAQVYFLGYTFLNEDGSTRKTITNNTYKNKIYSGIEAYFLSRDDGQTDPDRMVAVLFKTAFINKNNLRYLTGIPYLEDGELIARIMCLAARCIFDGQSFYRRTTRSGSATNSKLFYSEKAIMGFLDSAKNLRKFRDQPFLNQNQIKFLNQPIVKFAILPISGCSNRMTIKMFKYVITNLDQNNLNKLELNGCNKYYFNLGRIYNFSKSFLLVYIIFKNVYTSFLNLIKRSV